MAKPGCDPDGVAGWLCRSSTLPRATGLPLDGSELKIRRNDSDQTQMRPMTIPRSEQP